MSTNNFYSPEAIKPLYGEIAPVYQSAFAGEPWFEVSKCVDTRLRCMDGLSSVALGSTCAVCGDCPTLAAYEYDELINRFDQLASSRPTVWYTEQEQAGLALAALSWKATPRLIAKEKYSDAPMMTDWIERAIGTDEVCWLDEVFANKVLRTSGNLRNFGAMCNGFMERLKTDTLAFRTKNERMTAASVRDFGERAQVIKKLDEDPGRRDFVVIRSAK